MAVEAFKIPKVNPETPTYTDVVKDDPYYSYVETVTAAGLTKGSGAGLFDPDAVTTREQALAMITRWVAQRDGYVLSSMYTQADMGKLLGRFSDGDLVTTGLQAEIAFAVDFGIVVGNKGALAPKDALTRIQYAAVLIRCMGRPGDARSFYLGNFDGTVGADAEFAMNEAKDFSLSDVFDPKDEPVLTKIVKKKTDGYGVSYYLEKTLMLTDLFSEYDMTNLWVYIIYKKPAVLQAYLDLKAEEAALKAAGNYENETEKRASIAFRFGKILGYTDSYLRDKLKIQQPYPAWATTVDPQSFSLGNFDGVLGAESEFAMNESKAFSLSDVFDPNDEPYLSTLVTKKTESYGVSYYLEKTLMLTDLFSEYDMTNLWVYIIYKDQAVLQSYFDLKAEEAALKASGHYDTATEQRQSIAFRFGKILGYSDAYLKTKLHMN
jgi:hypothetical protein